VAAAEMELQAAAVAVVDFVQPLLLLAVAVL
jgi:hypothetical protein